MVINSYAQKLAVTDLLTEYFQKIPVSQNVQQVTSFLDSSQNFVLDSIQNQSSLFFHMPAGVSKYFFPDTATLFFNYSITYYQDSSKRIIDTAQWYSVTMHFQASKTGIADRDARFELLRKTFNSYYSNVTKGKHTGKHQKTIPKGSKGIHYRKEKYDNYAQVNIYKSSSLETGLPYLTLVFYKRLHYMVTPPSYKIDIRRSGG